MKHRKLTNRVIMLFLLLLVTSTGFAQINTEEEMAKAVFKTIQNHDLQTFTSYCASKERIGKMLEGMTETTPKEKAIKQELQQEDHEEFRKNCAKNFNLFIEELGNSNISLKKAKFDDIFLNHVRFDIPNSKASKLKFNMSFGDIKYQTTLNIFKTKDDMFIYYFYFQSDRNKEQ